MYIVKKERKKLCLLMEPLHRLFGNLLLRTLINLELSLSYTLRGFYLNRFFNYSFYFVFFNCIVFYLI